MGVINILSEIPPLSNEKPILCRIHQKAVNFSRDNACPMDLETGKSAFLRTPPSLAPIQDDGSEKRDGA